MISFNAHANLMDHPLMEYSGTLLKPAQARMRSSDYAGGPVPVLCMDILLDNQQKNVMHVEQPFPREQYIQARMAAKRLTKGTQVSVRTHLHDLQLVAPNAAHIHVINPNKEERA